MDFNDLWFNHAILMAKKSKDPRTQVGAVIVNQESRQLVSAGYNGPPRGFRADKWIHTLDKTAKALVCEHAERNAIFNAARLGMATDKCDIYITQSPCNDCARALIQAGIRTAWVPYQFYYGWPDIMGGLVSCRVIKEIKWEISHILIDGKEILLQKN